MRKQIILPEFEYFYFIRHGQTEANEQQLMAGGNNDLPLNMRGHEQARDASYILKTKCPEIQHIVSSDMLRAKQTAEYINQRFSLPKTELEELREWRFGEWEGKTWGQVSHLFLDLNIDPPGGETRSFFENRVLQGLHQALNKTSPVLIVAHGGVWFKIQKIFNLSFIKSNNCQIFKVQCKIKNGLVSYEYVNICL